MQNFNYTMHKGYNMTHTDNLYIATCPVSFHEHHHLCHPIPLLSPPSSSLFSRGDNAVISLWSFHTVCDDSSAISILVITSVFFFLWCCSQYSDHHIHVLVVMMLSSTFYSHHLMLWRYYHQHYSGQPFPFTCSDDNNSDAVVIITIFRSPQHHTSPLA